MVIAYLSDLFNVFLSVGQAYGILILAAMVVIVIAAALIVSAVFIGLFILLISLGVVSASIVSGLYQNSLSQGFKTFVVLISILGCSIISELLFWLIHDIFGWWAINTSLIIGLIPGIISGWFIGRFMFGTIKKIIIFVKNIYKER